MFAFALSTNQTAWWVTLAVGLVVLLVVLALLETLRRTVSGVEREVDAVWGMGKRLAQNTQAAHLLTATHARGAGVLAELERHGASTERKEL